MGPTQTRQSMTVHVCHHGCALYRIGRRDKIVLHQIIGSHYPSRGSIVVLRRLTDNYYAVPSLVAA